MAAAEAQETRIVRDLMKVIDGGGRRGRQAWELWNDMAGCTELAAIISAAVGIPAPENPRQVRVLVKETLRIAIEHSDEPQVRGAGELVGMTGLTEDQRNKIAENSSELDPNEKKDWTASKQARYLFAASHVRQVDVKQARSYRGQLVSALADAVLDTLEQRLDEVTDIAVRLRLLRHASPPIAAVSDRPFDSRFEFDPEKEQLALRGTAWADALRRMYPGFQLIQLGGTEFPIWVEQAPRADWAGVPRDKQWEKLESPLGELDTAVEPSFDTYNMWEAPPGARDFDPDGAEEFEYVNLTAHARNRHNGPAYAFLRMRRTERGRRLDARPGTYFDSVTTSEMLEREFVNAQARHPDSPVKLSQLPRRQWIHQQLMANRDPAVSDPPTPVLDGRYRSAALSVAVTMIFGNSGNRSALVTRRSTDVLTHPGFYHVAPSGIFSPLAVNWHGWRKEFSVATNVLREYAEELFNYKELEFRGSHLPSGLSQVPPIRRLLEAVADGAVAVRYCGIGVPLLTLRPEIYVLIYVRDEAWFEEQAGLAEYVDKRVPKLNWEYDPESGRQGIRLDLDDNFNPVDPRGVIRTYKMVPHAAAALHLAAQVARQVASETS